MLAVIWTIAIIVNNLYVRIGATVLTIAAAGGIVWFLRYIKKNQAIGALLRNADLISERGLDFDRYEVVGIISACGKQFHPARSEDGKKYIAL